MNKRIALVAVLAIGSLSACSDESSQVVEENVEAMEVSIEQEVERVVEASEAFSDELAAKVASIVEDTSVDVSVQRADELDALANAMVKKAETLKLNAKELREAAAVLRAEAR